MLIEFDVNVSREANVSMIYENSFVLDTEKKGSHTCEENCW